MKGLGRYSAAAPMAGNGGAFAPGRRGDQAGGSHDTTPRVVSGVSRMQKHSDHRSFKESVCNFCFPIEFQLLCHNETHDGLGMLCVIALLSQVYGTVKAS